LGVLGLMLHCGSNTENAVIHQSNSLLGTCVVERLDT
jgi:hypothetical protein